MSDYVPDKHIESQKQNQIGILHRIDNNWQKRIPNNPEPQLRLEGLGPKKTYDANPGPVRR